MFASLPALLLPATIRTQVSSYVLLTRADEFCLHVGVAGCSTRAEYQEHMDLDLGGQAQDGSQCNHLQSHSNHESVGCSVLKVAAATGDSELQELQDRAQLMFLSNSAMLLRRRLQVANLILPLQ